MRRLFYAGKSNKFIIEFAILQYVLFNTEDSIFILPVLFHKNISELALKLIAENKKTKAKFLDLGNCGLTEVPAEIGKCI